MADVRLWKKLERHPLSADYPDMNGKVWDEFVDGIRKHGVVNGRRIVLYEFQIIDGWQLYRGCLEADVRPEFVELKLPPGMTVEKWVETVNDLRRHESQDMVAKRISGRRQRVADARAD